MGVCQYVVCRDVLERLTTIGGEGVTSPQDPDFIVGKSEFYKRKY